MIFQTIIPFSFFRWCEATLIGTWLKGSVWGFPIIETIHIMGLTVLLGSIVIVDLRLLNFGLRRRPVTEIANQFMIIDETTNISIPIDYFFINSKTLNTNYLTNIFEEIISYMEKKTI